MSTPNGRMHAWRNIACQDSKPDAEIQAINAMEDELDPLPPEAGHIRALISRFDSLAHYKAADNLTLILQAVGSSSYPGMPAVDVLWRHERIDDDRRRTYRSTYHALQSWLAGKTLEQANEAHDAASDELHDVYACLGEPNGAKSWLAASLAKTLGEQVLVPEDVIAEHDDEAYILALYEAILHRHPSPDDLQFRLAELRNGMTRDEMFTGVLAAAEHTDHVRGHIAAILKRATP